MASGLTAQLRVSTEEELQAKLAEAKEELFNLRFQSATGQLESHGRLRAVKRDIARIYTVIRERELGIRATPAPLEQPAKAKRGSKKDDPSAVDDDAATASVTDDASTSEDTAATEPSTAPKAKAKEAK